jgi:phosphate transport system ATP-binding protein
VGVGIEVVNLNAWYGTNHTLQDINLNIPANRATALIGPSGCGKSTFVRCLNRMHETNPIARVTGTVRIGDLDIYEGTTPVEIRRRVGMVFQRPNPFPTMSVYDNVAAGLKLNGYSNRQALDEKPASALDPVSTSKIEDLIFQLKSQYTIVIVTHNMQQAARVAENTGFFLNGKMVEFDSTHKIFTNPRDKRTEDYITGRFG